MFEDISVHLLVPFANGVFEDEFLPEIAAHGAVLVPESLGEGNGRENYANERRKHDGVVRERLLERVAVSKFITNDMIFRGWTFEILAGRSMCKGTVNRKRERRI